MLEQGMKIKIFEDTDITAYSDMISDMGYKCIRKGEYLIVGRPYKWKRVGQPIGKTIKQARLNAGLTVKEVASRVGVIWETVANWEIGEAIPNKENALKLKEIIGWSGFEEGESK